MSRIVQMLQYLTLIPFLKLTFIIIWGSKSIAVLLNILPDDFNTTKEKNLISKILVILSLDTKLFCYLFLKLFKATNFYSGTNVSNSCHKQCFDQKLVVEKKVL